MEFRTSQLRKRWSWRRRLGIVATLLVVVLVTVLIVGAIRSPTPTPSAYSQAVGTPVAAPSASPPAQTLYDFEMEGDTDFPNVYTGGVHERDGSITFYVTRRDPELLAAIAAANPTKIRYRFVIVPYSYAEANGVTMSIAKEGDQLMREGVRLEEWGPDPRTSLVVVHLQKPQESDLKALASTRGVPLSAVTTQTYPEQVEALLKSRFGPGLQVSLVYMQPATFD
ncbi:MAG TPA: hypothetical protein VKU87_12460 [Thermomicrobiaceae bacterium]|nr:hypothetical protein [Thermomicrobiaceae bacterium]